MPIIRAESWETIREISGIGGADGFFTAGFFCPKTGSINTQKNKNNKKLDVLNITWYYELIE
jgi:hypothetical protein